jgi:Ca2+-binding EF-hand superfamily protein
MAMNLFEKWDIRDCTALLHESGRRLLAAARADEPKKECMPRPPPLLESATHVDLQQLNPSLYSIGIDIVEQLQARYLEKAGRACERMQQTGLPVDVIQTILLAVFSKPTAAGQPSASLEDIFSIFDSSGDGLLDLDEFNALVPLLGEVVPAGLSTKLFETVDMNDSGTISLSEFEAFVRGCNPTHTAQPDGWRVFFSEGELETAAASEQVLLQMGKVPTRGGRWTLLKVRLSRDAWRGARVAARCPCGAGHSRPAA